MDIGGGVARQPIAPASPGGAADPLALSVVIPTRDTRELTLRCLAALDAARPPVAEIVVVDDGSTDGTAAAIGGSYPAVRLLRQPQPRGFTAAVTAGVAQARHDLVLLLNSDTEVAPAAPAALVDAFAAAPGLGVAGAALFYPDGRPQWSGGQEPRPLWLLTLGSGLAHRLGAVPGWRRLRRVSGHRGRVVDWVSGAALAFRRAVWDAVGGLDPRFSHYAQDLDFCIEARRRGWEVRVVTASRVLHHHGGTVACIGAAGAARTNAPLLWADLVRWAEKRHGSRSAQRTARLLGTGGAVQRLLLTGEGLMGRERGRRAAAERQALREAAAAARAAARLEDHRGVARQLAGGRRA